MPLHVVNGSHSQEKKLANDESRTVTLIKAIYQLKILKLFKARNRANDVAWFEQFNDDRKRYDFVCYVAYIHA